MSRHTPGPWLVRQRDYYRDQYEIGLSDFDGLIKGLSGTRNGHDGYMHVSGCMSAADAHLMAAAPDLLEALEMMIADFGDYPAADRPVLAFERARDAIAKAKGEQP
jgi:hypothetical protein